MIKQSDEIVTWLNANATFKRRGIAYLDGGKASIRSRNLGDTYSLALLAGPVTTAVFGGDVSIKVVGGFTASNSLAAQSNAANNDPKVTRLVEKITYTLDPVDDLIPGTYIANIEVGDRGRISDTDYRTPTVARVTFQVGSGTLEMPVAKNCASPCTSQGRAPATCWRMRCAMSPWRKRSITLSSSGPLQTNLGASPRRWFS